MTEHWFYHLQQSSLEQVLPDILEKTYAKPWRTLVKVGPCLGELNEKLKRLDRFLWTYKQDGFLPHGRDDEPMAAEHPICMSVDVNTAAGYDVAVLIGGAELGDVGGVQRCITILDGGDAQDRATARARWKQAKEDGLTTAYWKQDDYGKWMKPDL